MASDVNLQMEVIKTTGNFDQETLDRGKLYFINIQALAKTTSLVKPGNGRNWSIWETLDNTVRERGRDFIVVVDEAHRGAQPDKSTASIVQTIVGGDHPVPIVVGISATATKFLATVEAGQTSSRTIRPVHVKMVDVQASGLVKDRIVLYSPDDDEHEVNADTTLIRHAVRRTREYEARWTEYTERQDGEAVSPALVIQLEDSPTEAHLREVYDAVIGEWPELNTSNFVNTFSDHKAESLGGGLFIQYHRMGLPPCRSPR
jgi:type III restriction enzyme